MRLLSDMEMRRSLGTSDSHPGTLPRLESKEVQVRQIRQSSIIPEGSPESRVGDQGKEPTQTTPVVEGARRSHQSSEDNL